MTERKEQKERVEALQALFDAGIGGATIARYLGVSEAIVSRWRSGLRNMSDATYQKLKAASIADVCAHAEPLGAPPVPRDVLLQRRVQRQEMGDILRLAMKTAGMTPADMAAKWGRQVASCRKWLSGRHSAPDEVVRWAHDVFVGKAQ
jgi:transcriptional regulator with XRE-family HTH domain